jgi:mono/diheme cytochrome c family protein
MRKALRIVGALVAAIVLAAAGFVALTNYRYGRAYDPPYPAVARATSPEALARGEKLFRTICAGCHVDGSGRARGMPLPDFPAFMGSYHSANLTSDPKGGIGAWSDAELARFLRTAIDRDGNFRPMPPLRTMGDADVAAVIGFMRSPDPLFSPVAEKAPRSVSKLAGKIVFAWIFGIHADTPVSIPVPPKGPTVEYGRYTAGIYDCGMCHTEGFGGNKANEPGGYGGGFEFEDAQGRTIYSPNITFDPSGLGGKNWSRADFVRVLSQGTTPDGRVLRPPMPVFGLADADELGAIYEFLKTVPKVDRPRKKGTQPEARASSATDPEALWTGLGCVGCHGDGAPFRDKIKQSLGKPVADVARWIRDAQSIKPGTQMPTFHDVLDEPRALALAAWVQARAASL